MAIRLKTLTPSWERSAPSQPDNGRLECPAIEQLDGLSLRSRKIERARDCLRIGQKPVAQFPIQQGSADQFRQMPARHGSGVGIEFIILQCRLPIGPQRSAEANRFRRVNSLHTWYGSAGKCHERIQHGAADCVG